MRKVFLVCMLLELMGCERTIFNLVYCERAKIDTVAMTITYFGCDDPRYEGRTFPWNGEIPTGVVIL